MNTWSYRFESYLNFVLGVYALALMSWFLGTVGVMCLPFQPHWIAEGGVYKFSASIFIVCGPALWIAFLASKGEFDDETQKKALIACTCCIFVPVLWVGMRYSGVHHAFAMNCFAALLLLGMAVTFAVGYVGISRGLAAPISWICKKLFKSP
jgi:hypothetical protein